MTARRVAVLGARGQLGRELVVGLNAAEEYEVIGFARPEFDLTRPSDLEAVVAIQPDVVINAAAWTDVDGCAREPTRAMQINGLAAGAVAEASARTNAWTIQVSTNEVFDGARQQPYAEDDEPNPLNPYGASKLEGERLVATANPRHAIVRTAWLFSTTGSNFVTKIRDAGERARATGSPLRVVADEWGNPTPAAWLSGAMIKLLDLLAGDRAGPGRFHLAGWPPISRHAWAVALLGDDGGPVLPITLAEYPRDSCVPPRAVLDVSLARSLGIQPADWRAEIWGTASRPKPDRLQ